MAGHPDPAKAAASSDPEPARILVVEDDPAVRELVVGYLAAQGMDVTAVGDGRAMRAALARASFDLVVLDLGLPDEDGLTLAAELARKPRPGVLMLTGRDSVADRVRGLGLGADDYLTKPFEPRELLARVRSILRRMPAVAPPESASRRVAMGQCLLDHDARCLIDPSGAEVTLTAMEYDLLAVFARHPGQALSRDQLMRLAHERDWDPLDRGIDIRITRLRQKLEPDSAHPTVITTVRGIGYRFAPNPPAAGRHE